ncbi:Ank3, partial [Symbiodinium pilosum]
ARADPNAGTEEGSRPLVVAAAEGFPDIATLLLDARAYVNQGTKEGWTPLLAASGATCLRKEDGEVDMSQASSGHKEVVCILLESNAVWDQSDRHGTTPLLMACAQGHEEIVGLLLDKANARAGELEI